MPKQYLLLSFLFLASCGSQINSSPPPALSGSDALSIVGGQAVQDEVFAKHVVALFNQKSGVLCTATLIAPNIVLTAAHCANADNISDYFIVFSKTLRTEGPAFRAATARVIYDYNPKAFYDRKDLALIRFQGPLPPGFEPMFLPNAQDFRSMGNHFYAAGYGSITARTDTGGRKNGILRYTQLKILEKKLTPKLPQFTVNQMKGQGICHGDSGGPAFVKIKNRRVLVGVASAVYTFEENPEQQPRFDLCRHYSIYISTYYYLNWIRKASAALSR